jgi:hypothetical protein
VRDSHELWLSAGSIAVPRLLPLTIVDWIACSCIAAYVQKSLIWPHGVR